jgi:hypothetical protein
MKTRSLEGARIYPCHKYNDIRAALQAAEKVVSVAFRVDALKGHDFNRPKSAAE